MNVFEETEPTALISRAYQINEIRNVTFTVLRERHVKYFYQNRQQEYPKSFPTIRRELTCHEKIVYLVQIERMQKYIFEVLHQIELNIFLRNNCCH